MEEHQTIEIPDISLIWSCWTPWLKVGQRVYEGGANLPKAPGVYEVKLTNQDERLTIGRSSNLRMRVKQHLLKAQGHPAGEKIKADIDSGDLDPNDMVVRWTTTDRPAAAEEALHKRHIQLFGDLPTYTKAT